MDLRESESLKLAKHIIFVPTYNEKENISILLFEIFQIMPQIHILVIDDSSPDGTAEVVLNLMTKYPHLHLFKRPQKNGLGSAYIDAIRWIINKNLPYLEAIITMDADGSHRPEYVPILLQCLDGADLVVGSRYIDGGGIQQWEVWRRLLSRFGNFYARALTGIPLSDLTSGFICVKKEILKKINFKTISASGYAYQMEFKFFCVFNAKASVKEIPILFQNRREGESKLSNQIIQEGIKIPIRLFLRRFRV
ncbi:MAG: hypothetical protein A3C10_03425 [Candidatus Magasanikbacteria bacterium RIFCSPHIGHO2_02_FULL_48_18]|nr:MAG: hypothetical protein A3I74_03145 [Candidatus Magasanikbacteria bacterium RIFCSPLOWO2_02_FULL_47_16]OGH80287.1 MAG: hypothetical protein A3C10_03425 [Candidatus Magasanikbacteria bacterium RIFCSPHIGHO2_02_FULL_48_18]